MRWQRREEKRQAIKQRMPKHGRSLKTLAAQDEAKYTRVEVVRGSRFNYGDVVCVAICATNGEGTKWKCHLENFPSITLYFSKKTILDNLIP